MDLLPSGFSVGGCCLRWRRRHCRLRNASNVDDHHGRDERTCDGDVYALSHENSKGVYVSRFLQNLPTLLVSVREWAGERVTVEYRLVWCGGDFSLSNDVRIMCYSHATTTSRWPSVDFKSVCVTLSRQRDGSSCWYHNMKKWRVPTDFNIWIANDLKR